MKLHHISLQGFKILAILFLMPFVIIPKIEFVFFSIAAHWVNIFTTLSSMTSRSFPLCFGEPCEMNRKRRRESNYCKNICINVCPVYSSTSYRGLFLKSEKQPLTTVNIPTFFKNVFISYY